jgi:hypothetical protein
MKAKTSWQAQDREPNQCGPRRSICMWTFLDCAIFIELTINGKRMVDVGIWLYRVSKCGYYPWRSGSGAAPRFGGLSQTFAQLCTWAAGKRLGETATFVIDDEDELSSVYFLTSHHHATTGDYLMVVWNRLPGNRQNISSVGVSDVVGSATAEITEFDENRIPGYATYFWVMPSANRVATVNLKSLNKGLPNLSAYVQNFLKFVNPGHVVIAPDEGPDGEIVVAGYRPTPTDPMLAGVVRPSFNVKPISLGGDIAYLRANVDWIDKVICKTVIPVAEEHGHAWWQTMLEMSRIRNRRNLRVEEAPVQVQFPISLTLDDLNRTINAWADDLNNVENRASDIGFHIRGGETRWLSKTQARTSIPLEVQWIDEELVDLRGLMTQLQLHRAQVLRLG